MSAPANLVYTQGTGAPPVSADNLNTFAQWQINVAGMRSFSGLPNMMVFMQGTTAPNDGGQGFFYWNTVTGTDDNGITTIVPIGSTGGCWTRVPVSVSTNSVTNTQLAQAPANTIKGNPTGVLANEQDMTVGQMLSLLQLTSLTPQGRLSLSATNPVMTTDVTAQTVIYYLPYAGQLVPISDGTRYLLASIGNVAPLPLNTSAHLSGNVYDIFVIFSSGNPTLGTGPAWATTTSRGTGGGTTQISQQNGLWANTNVINLINGTNTYPSIPAGQATYLGSFYATANGQTGMQFLPTPASGGTNNILGLYNAYNRIRITSTSRDSTTSWSYTTSVYRPANNSTSNRVTFLDGLQQSFVDGAYTVGASVSSTDVNASISLNFNATNGAGITVAQQSGLPGEVTITSPGASDPLFGLNYAQAIEYSTLSASTFYANGETQALKIILEM